MDAEIKRKWVEALRSGAYKQGKSVLRTRDDAFCCLGVLCDLIAPSDWQKAKGGTFWHDDKSFAFPPDSILDASGVHRDQTNLLWPLANMNDNGASFSEIADYIEANL